MAGQTFPSLLAACFPVVPSKLRITNPNDPPEERIVTVDDVFSAICDATEWIEANVDDLEVKISLLQRFSLRSASPVLCILDVLLMRLQDFIYGTAYLSSPFQTTEDQIRFYLSRALATATAITNTPSPLLNFQPPLELQAIFRRGAEVPLSSLQPIRVLDPLTRDESCSRMINMIGDLISGLECWKGWNEGTSWEGLRVSFKWKAISRH